jgi:hypothetical protein
MKVRISQLAVAMELKNTGMTLEVRNSRNALIGRCKMSKSGIRWLRSGKHGANKSYPWRRISWEDFTTLMSNVRGHPTLTGATSFPITNLHGASRQSLTAPS